MTTTDDNVLATRFQADRSHLQAVALRMLGSVDQADDALQEAWLRVSRADATGVDNLGGWLTTIVSRVCLDMLRARKARREESLDAPAGEAVVHQLPSAATNAEEQRVLADSLGAALMVVLDTLAPPERLAFVLHDLFDLPFEDIAPIVGRSPTAARQLASRARRRVQGRAGDDDQVADEAHRRAVIEAFLKAAHGGDLAALLTVLDPDIVVRADAAAVAVGAAPVVRGATAVTQTFLGRALGARRVRLDGMLGLAWAPGGTVKVVFDLTVADGRITAIDLIADPDVLRAIAFEALEPLA